jgi:hypothetical protein
MRDWLIEGQSNSCIAYRTSIPSLLLAMPSISDV